MIEQLPSDIKFDEIGTWSELKHEIVKEYAAAYSTISLPSDSGNSALSILNAFSGAGLHLSRTKVRWCPAVRSMH